MNIEPRRAFLKRLRFLAAAPVLAGGGTLAWGSTLERHRLVVEKHDLPLALGASGPQKFRAVVLSDFHFDPLFEHDYLLECVRRANELKPDIVFLLGDYISKSVARVDELAAILSKLEQRAGIYACLGNHDHWEDPRYVIKCLGKTGIVPLMNQHTRVPCAGGDLVIAGLASVWGGDPRWPDASKGLKPDDRIITLMHEPDYIGQLRPDAKRIALQLSGHTHGGQVCLPFFGPLHLPRWGHKYDAGFYDVDGIKLYVNRGIGTVHVDVRLFCPPEISCFDITNTSLAA